MSVVVNVHLMVGLPGSGKTYYVKNKILPTLNKQVETVIHFDADDYLVRDMNKYKAYEKKLNGHYSDIMYNVRRGRNNVHIVIDGLFLTNSEVHKIVEITKKELDYMFGPNTLQGRLTEIKYELFFRIHQWNEDRDACLSNDPSRLCSNGGDRDKSSSATIKHATYETIKVDEFKKEFPDIHFKLIEHVVVAYTPFEIAGAEGNGFLRSNSWVTGGRWGDYQGNEGEIEAEPEEEFTQFDDFVESICPNISHRDYRTLWKACVEQKEKYEQQYYGGYENTSYWECDLDKLHDKMLELGLIEK